MMPNIRKKQKYSAVLLMASAFLSLMFVAFFFISIKSYLADSNNFKYQIIADEQNQGYDTKDQLMTKKIQTKQLSAPIINGQDPLLGEKNAKITIVLYSDFACPACIRQEENLRQILTEYRGIIRLIRKDYPDQDKNSLSYRAASAARCAEEQNKFWPFHDLLTQQLSLAANPDLYTLIKQAKINSEQFYSCLEQQRSQTRIQANIAEANRLKLPGVPFIFINQQEILGQASLADLKHAIEAELTTNR